MFEFQDANGSLSPFDRVNNTAISVVDRVIELYIERLAELQNQDSNSIQLSREFARDVRPALVPLSNPKVSLSDKAMVKLLARQLFDSLADSALYYERHSSTTPPESTTAKKSKGMVSRTLADALLRELDWRFITSAEATQQLSLSKKNIASLRSDAAGNGITLARLSLIHI